VERICKSWGVNIDLGGQSWIGSNLLLAGLAGRTKSFSVSDCEVQSQSLIVQGRLKEFANFKVIEVGGI
jgi:hypothetical protein